MYFPSKLREWALENRLIEKKKTQTLVESHRLLDGGILYVNPHQMEDFFKVYVESLERGQQVFVTETITTIFHLCIDMDFKSPKEIPRNVLLKYCKTIQRVVNEFARNVYEPVQCKVIVTASSPRKLAKKDEKDPQYIKNGVHMNWPGILVDIRDALLIRKAVIIALKKQFGKRDSYNRWDDVIDESIYRHGGLRMIGSAKTEKCKKCNGRGRNCVTCMAQGRIIDKDGIYSLFSVLDSDNEVMSEEIEALRSDRLRLVKETSIKSFEKETGHDEFKLFCPEWFIRLSSQKDFNDIDNMANNKRTVTRKRKQVDPPGWEDKEGLDKLKIRHSISENDDRYVETVKFINSQLPAVYRNCIVDMYCCDGNNYYVVTTNSKFCMNKGGEHGGNTIYFYINSMGCYQKCHCKCNDTKGRKFGLCSKYKSSCYRLTSKLNNLLFSHLNNFLGNGKTAIAETRKKTEIKAIDTGDKKYIRLSTKSGEEHFLRKSRIGAIDELLEMMYEDVSEKREWEHKTFRFSRAGAGRKKQKR